MIRYTLMRILRCALMSTVLLQTSAVLCEEVSSVAVCVPRRIALFDPSVRDALSTQPSRTYAVQVVASLDAKSAESERTRFEKLGYEPAWIDGSSVWKRVMIGRFSTYCQALVIKTALRENGHCDDAFIQNVETPERLAPVTNAAPVQSVFALERRPFLADLSLSFDNDQAPIKEGGQRLAMNPTQPMLAPSTTDDASLIGRLSAPDADADCVDQVLLRAKVRSQQSGGLLPARALLKPIAEGSAAATPRQRHEAMWLLARVYHAAGWRLAAYRAYSDLGEACQSKSDLARALCERVGLVLELAESGKGCYADVRQAAAEALPQISAAPGQCRKMRAVIELMRVESLYYDKQYPVAASEIEKYMAEYASHPECSREVNLMSVWQAQTFREIGRRLEAKAILASLVDSGIRAEDCFPNMNIEVLSALFLGEMGVEDRNVPETNKWVGYLATKYPDRADAANLVRLRNERIRDETVSSRKDLP